MRILAYVNHFFGRETAFRGKSTSQLPTVRRRIVEEVCRSLRALPGEVEVRVCGDGKNHLVAPDLSFALNDPRHLVFASIEHQLQLAEEYDYLINMEDDVCLSAATFETVVAFDAAHPLDKAFLPNRIEGERRGHWERGYPGAAVSVGQLRFHLLQPRA